MSMQVRPGYVNPLTVKKENRLNPKAGQALKAGSGSGEVRELESRQQHLQNTMLLMKAASSDGGGMSQKTEEKLKEELEQVAVELRRAKSGVQMEKSQPEEERKRAPRTGKPGIRRDRDIYEKSEEILPELEKERE